MGAIDAQKGPHFAKNCEMGPNSVLSERDAISPQTAKWDPTEAGQSEAESLKLVPVAESIRYRKRAQVAERKVETLVQELADAKSEASQMTKQLDDIKVEQQLTRKLAAAGTVDLETAVLIARARVGAEGTADIDSVVEQLKREKQHLFANNGRGAAAKKTAGARDRIQNSQAIVERAAKKAATTGSRKDLHEYLKLRRNFV